MRAHSRVPGRHRGRSALGCPQRPGARSHTPNPGTALRAVGLVRPLRGPRSPFTGQVRCPPPRAPASPRRHHHIVDDQVRRGQRPRALLLPRAAGFAGPGPAPATPIPPARCSCRRYRHVKCREPALFARAPPPELGTARGRWEGRRRRGGGRGGGARDSAHGGRHLGGGQRRSLGSTKSPPPSWIRVITASFAS